MPMSGADWAKLAAGVGGTALTAYMMKRQGDQQAQVQQQGQQMTEEQSLRDTALKESLADPFRNLRNQQRGLTSLDMLQHFGERPSVTPPSNLAPYMGTVNRGFTPSDRLRTDAGKLYDAVAAGQTAPTMTDPANYGRTGVLNLSQPSAPTAGQGGAGASAMDAIDPMSYLASYERRKEGAGGVGAGAKAGLMATAGTFNPYAIAAGTVGGAIVGAFTKNAKTAMTDLTIDDARQAIQNVFQKEGGRSATPEQVDEILAGQGWKPGNRWVGEANLVQVIRNLESNFSKERRGQAA